MLGSAAGAALRQASTAHAAGGASALPLRPPRPVLAIVAVRGTAIDADNRIRVLIVDDHLLFTHALRQTLESDGRFEVVGTAATGREAVVLAKQADADVVLMDLSMPRLDGLAATRRLLKLDRAPRVIALSGHTDALSRTAAIEAGAAAFLTKTEAYDTVVDTIVDVCTRE